MSAGPFLYDDDPAPLHTGVPRRRNGLLLVVFGGTVVLGVLMVLALPLVKGSGEEQAREAVGVFLAALEQGDTETAHELLCAQERGRLDEDDVATTYLAGAGGRVAGAEADGGDVQVRVTWDDGSAAILDVVNEDGARVCGLVAAGD